MKDWIKKALELKNSGTSWSKLPEIINKEFNLDKNMEQIRSALRPHLNSDKKEETTENTNPKEELLNLLKKESSLEELAKELKLSERIVKAYIEDLKEEGYNVQEYSDKLILSKHIMPEQNEYSDNWKGEKIIKFGVVSDTHLCNKWQQLTFLNYIYDLFRLEGITTVYHSGDISDGYYKNRPGHIYELFKVGADEQAEYIINNYPKREGIETKFITGNHDDTHIMNGGVNIGKQIARDRKDMIYLGCNNAIVNLTPNCKMEVNHPGDGTAYAISYSIQKYMDSMTGGEKPHILLNGHHHKGLYIFYRNIHAFEAGTIEAQTPFMKSHRISAMMGGWIMEVHVDSEGTITRCKGEFIPLYKPLENDY